MDGWLQVVLAVTGFNLVVLVGLIFRAGSVFREFKSLIHRHEKCPIDTVVKDIAVMRRENDILWRNISLNLGDALREKTHPDRDVLIDKMNHDAATESELRKLYTTLRNDFVEIGHDNPIHQGRQVANAILMARVEQQLVRIRGGV